MVSGHGIALALCAHDLRYVCEISASAPTQLQVNRIFMLIALKIYIRENSIAASLFRHSATLTLHNPHREQFKTNDFVSKSFSVMGTLFLNRDVAF